MITIHIGNLPQPTLWFGPKYNGSMPCLEILDFVTCTIRCKHNTTIHIYACTLNVLHVTNINVPRPLVLAMVYSPTGILLMLLGRKLQLISLTHGLCQHHVVLWNSLLSHVLIPWLILLRLQGPLTKLATMLQLNLSKPGSLGTLDQWKSSMTMGDSLQVLLFNRCYACWILNQFQLQTKTCMLVPFESEWIRLLQLHQAMLLVDNALATGIYALWSTVSAMLQATFGGLAFSHDMFLDIPLLEDWQAILTCREQFVNDALLHANKKHINFDYQIGQKVLNYDKTLQDKLKPKTVGPFDILWVH